MFIFFGAVALVGAVFLLGDLKNAWRPKKEVKVDFSFAGGLEPGSKVSYAGLEVGRVKHIHLLDLAAGEDKDRVTVTLEIEPSIQLKKDSAAAIKTSGLMGGFYIDIRPGSKSAPALPGGEHLQGQGSFEIAAVGDMMEEVVQQTRRFTTLVEGLADDTRLTLASVRESLGLMNQLVTNNRDGLEKSLRHVASFSEQADGMLKNHAAKLSDIVAQTHRATRELEILLADVRPDMTSLVRNMDTGTRQVAGSIDKVAANVEGTFGQSSSMLMENRRDLLLLVKNLKETSGSLKRLSEDLERNPWKIVRKTDEPPPESKPKPAAPPHKELRMQRLDKMPETK